MRAQLNIQKDKEFKRGVESEPQRKITESVTINQKVDQQGQTSSDQDLSAELNSNLNAAVIDLRIGKHNEQALQTIGNLVMDARQLIRGEQFIFMLEVLVRVLNKEAVETLNCKNWRKCQQILQLCDELTLPHQADEFVEARSLTINNFGCMHKRLGNYEAALQCFEKALSLQMSSGSSRYLGYTHLNISAILNFTEQHSEALHQARKAVMQLERDLDNLKKEDTNWEESKTEICNNLALALHNVAVENEYFGNPKEAQQNYERAVSFAEEAFGSEHLAVVKFRQALNSVNEKLDEKRQVTDEIEKKTNYGGNNYTDFQSSPLRKEEQGNEQFIKKIQELKQAYNLNTQALQWRGKQIRIRSASKKPNLGNQRPEIKTQGMSPRNGMEFFKPREVQTATVKQQRQIDFSSPQTNSIRKGRTYLPANKQNLEGDIVGSSEVNYSQDGKIKQNYQVEMIDQIYWPMPQKVQSLITSKKSSLNGTPFKRKRSQDNRSFNNSEKKQNSQENNLSQTERYTRQNVNDLIEQQYWLKKEKSQEVNNINSSQTGYQKSGSQPFQKRNNFINGTEQLVGADGLPQSVKVGDNGYSPQVNRVLKYAQNKTTKPSPNQEKSILDMSQNDKMENVSQSQSQSARKDQRNIRKDKDREEVSEDIAFITKYEFDEIIRQKSKERDTIELNLEEKRREHQDLNKRIKQLKQLEKNEKELAQVRAYQMKQLDILWKKRMNQIKEEEKMQEAEEKLKLLKEQKKLSVGDQNKIEKEITNVDAQQEKKQTEQKTQESQTNISAWNTQLKANTRYSVIKEFQESPLDVKQESTGNQVRLNKSLEQLEQTIKGYLAVVFDLDLRAMIIMFAQQNTKELQPWQHWIDLTELNDIKVQNEEMVRLFETVIADNLIVIISNMLLQLNSLSRVNIRLGEKSRLISLNRTKNPRLSRLIEIEREEVIKETELTLKRNNGCLVTGSLGVLTEQTEGESRVLVFEFWSGVEYYSYSINYKSEQEKKDYLDQFEAVKQDIIVGEDGNLKIDILVRTDKLSVQNLEQAEEVKDSEEYQIDQGQDNSTEVLVKESEQQQLQNENKQQEESESNQSIEEKSECEQEVIQSNEDQVVQKISPIVLEQHQDVDLGQRKGSIRVEYDQHKTSWLGQFTSKEGEKLVHEIDCKLVADHFRKKQDETAELNGNPPTEGMNQILQQITEQWKQAINDLKVNLTSNQTLRLDQNWVFTDTHSSGQQITQTIFSLSQQSPNLTIIEKRAVVCRQTSRQDSKKSLTNLAVEINQAEQQQEIQEVEERAQDQQQISQISDNKNNIVSSEIQDNKEEAVAPDQVNNEGIIENEITNPDDKIIDATKNDDIEPQKEEIVNQQLVTPEVNEDIKEGKQQSDLIQKQQKEEDYSIAMKEASLIIQRWFKRNWNQGFGQRKIAKEDIIPLDPIEESSSQSQQDQNNISEQQNNNLEEESDQINQNSQNEQLSQSINDNLIQMDEQDIDKDKEDNTKKQAEDFDITQNANVILSEAKLPIEKDETISENKDIKINQIEEQEEIQNHSDIKEQNKLQSNNEDQYTIVVSNENYQDLVQYEIEETQPLTEQKEIDHQENKKDSQNQFEETQTDNGLIYMNELSQEENNHQVSKPPSNHIDSEIIKEETIKDQNEGQQIDIKSEQNQLAQVDLKNNDSHQNYLIQSQVEQAEQPKKEIESIHQQASSHSIQKETISGQQNQQITPNLDSLNGDDTQIEKDKCNDSDEKETQEPGTVYYYQNGIDPVSDQISDNNQLEKRERVLRIK